MTPTELYDLLDKASIDYELIEIFEGVRILSIEVDEDEEVPDESSNT